MMMIVAGLALDAAAMAQIRLGETNIPPQKAATELMFIGVFAVSRNPICLGNTIAVAGAALALDNALLLAAALVAAAAVERMAIRREEPAISSKRHEPQLDTPP